MTNFEFPDYFIRDLVLNGGAAIGGICFKRISDVAGLAFRFEVDHHITEGKALIRWSEKTNFVVSVSGLDFEGRYSAKVSD